MLKRYRKTMIITSVIILLPVLAGLVLMDRLPEQIPIHWNFNGNADNYGSPLFAIVGLPLILLAAHWLCFLGTMLDKRNVNQNAKPLSTVLYIFPFISLISCTGVYAAALGYEFSLTNIMTALLGLMFILIGNYMPKIRLNATLGIKIPWTLTNEENWNLTHRFAGRIWVFGGALMMIAALLPANTFAFVLPTAMIVMILLPMLYSYRHYRRKKAQGAWEVNGVVLAGNAKRISSVIGIVILILVAILMFTGNIDYTLNEEHFDIAATYWSDSTIPYADISSIEYREEGVDGLRTSGFGSARLLMGQFHNDEFGYYTRYTYTGGKPAIVLTIGERTLVIGCKTAEATQALYEDLTARIAID